MRKVVLGLLGLVMLAAVWLMASRWGINYSLHHRGWSSVDEEADDEMREVTQLPVLWLGESYDADGDGTGELELSAFDIRGSNARDPRGVEHNVPQYEMYLGYGRCKFPPVEGGCALPLSVVFDPPCDFIGDPPRIPDVRGVEARDAGDSIYLLTRDYQIRIWPPRAGAGYVESALRVAEALRGANDLARGVTPGSGLPRRPDAFC